MVWICIVPNLKDSNVIESLMPLGGINVFSWDKLKFCLPNLNNFG